MGEGYMVAVNFISPSTQPLQLQLNSYTVAAGKHVDCMFGISDKEAYLYIRLTWHPNIQ